MLESLYDTDVLIKLAGYDLFSAVAHPGCDGKCQRSSGYVVAAKFVARKNLERRAKHPHEAIDRLEGYLPVGDSIEPTSEEIDLAAEFEAAAQDAGLDLDIGESQLTAIALLRAVPLIVTGDKRAIVAAEKLLDSDDRLRSICGRVACFKQAASLAVQRVGAHTVRTAVEAEPKMDTTMNICFATSAPSVPEDFYPVGLVSYIEDLRAGAPAILLDGELLSVPVT